MAGRIMIMAGGTGGHVFPALAVAEELRQRGWEVFWLGTRNSFEARVIPLHGIGMEWIDIKGVRGKRLLQKLLLPVRLMHAMYQAVRVIRRRNPGVVLGMGGFVSGPGGLVSRMMGKPLVIQEQNTIPGMTNRWLAKIASVVFEAFPGSFERNASVRVSGNPVRKEMFSLPEPEARLADRSGRPRLLILGGSLGAQALNETMPKAIAKLSEEVRPLIRHQSGKDKITETRQAYADAGIDAMVTEFVDDMAEAYAWADLVVCRSGALTVSELAAVGVASLLVPYPYAVDDHQTANARFLVDANAAVIMQQSDMTEALLAEKLEQLLSDRGRLVAMACSAHELSKPQATSLIADACEELLV